MRLGREALKPRGGGAMCLTTISCSFLHLEGCLPASLWLPGSRLGTKDIVPRAGQRRQHNDPLPRHC